MTITAGLPTEPVGSLPRPASLQKVIDQLDAGKATIEDLRAEQEKAVKDSIERFEQTGSPIISDGEQRSSSFATYSIMDTLGGAGLANGLAPGGQLFAKFTDGHKRQLPKLVKGPFAYKTFAADYFKLSSRYTMTPMKQAVIAPSMLSLLYPLDSEIPGYTREAFHKDLINEAEKDVREAFKAGAKRVSVDFTEGRLALRNDPENPWTGRNMLRFFIDLNNQLFNRFTKEELVNIGVHTCPGGDCDSTHSADVDYAGLLSELFDMNAGYFLIQCASESNRERIYELCGKYSKPNQVVFIGVVDPLKSRVESPEEIRDELLKAAKYIPKERLGSTDDCGMSPFSKDEKPTHQGGPDAARDIAFRKIKARVEGTAMASKSLFG